MNTNLEIAKLLRMDIVEIRRENLRRWVAEHGTPAKEKSLFSQLKSNASFGEKVARRLEEQYKMGAGYLDQDPNAAAPKPDPVEAAIALFPGAMRVRAADEDDPAFVQIPKVKLRLSAGLSGFEVEPESYDGSTTTVPTDWMQRRGYSRDHLLAIRVRGESMEPTFYEDDLVVINTADKKPSDGGVYAINYEGEPVVKRMERDAGDWWLKSDNADQRKFSRKICRGDACLIIGKVVRKESERF